MQYKKYTKRKFQTAGNAGELLTLTNPKKINEYNIKNNTYTPSPFVPNDKWQSKPIVNNPVIPNIQQQPVDNSIKSQFKEDPNVDAKMQQDLDKKALKPSEYVAKYYQTPVETVVKAEPRTAYNTYFYNPSTTHGTGIVPMANNLIGASDVIGAGMLAKQGIKYGIRKLAPVVKNTTSKLFKPSFKSEIDWANEPQQLIDVINERLSKGLGVKKHNVPLSVSLAKDEKGYLQLNTYINNELAGNIHLRQNQIRPKTFLESIIGRKIKTPIEKFDNTIGYSKYKDYPFKNISPSNDDIYTETGERVPKRFYKSGISGEFNKAINETLKEKGLGNLLSTRSGLQTTLGKQRWENLVKKGLAESLGNNLYKMKKHGGKLKTIPTQSKLNLKVLPLSYKTNK